jgi:hypothetical protein
MNNQAASAAEVARRILDHEGAAAQGGESPSAALGTAWRKLAGGLEPLLGRGGADALIARAVTLARREFPSLALVRTDADGPVAFAGLDAPGAEGGDTGASTAGVAVLAALLGLLVGLLGEELGLWPARVIWPNAVPGGSAPRSTEGEG